MHGSTVHTQGQKQWEISTLGCNGVIWSGHFKNFQLCANDHNLLDTDHTTGTFHPWFILLPHQDLNWMLLCTLHMRTEWKMVNVALWLTQLQETALLSSSFQTHKKWWRIRDWVRMRLIMRLGLATTVLLWLAWAKSRRLVLSPISLIKLWWIAWQETLLIIPDCHVITWFQTSLHGVNTGINWAWSFALFP